MQHTPVLRDELVEAITTDVDGVYIDATFGRGGHARALLERLGDGARLLAIDRDDAAVRAARELGRGDPRVVAAKGRFGDVARVAAAHGFAAVNGVMLDIGVSSPQLDDPQRGFSFLHEGPLDMRMDATDGPTAAAWLNDADEAEIARVLRVYGEERNARAIARAIVRARPLATTGELAAVVAASSPRRDPNKHAATRVFQAVRIQINDELGELDRGLDAAFELLVEGGRLGVVSFHSLEHRMVRRRMRAWVEGNAPRRLPVPGPVRGTARYVVRGRRPGEAEVLANPRARSALLQVVEKAA